MEDNRRGGNGRRFEGRREYGNRNGSDRRASGERKSYGEGRSFGGERKSFGNSERRSFNNGERKSFGGERRSFGSSEGRSFNGEKRSFNGERKSFGKGNFGAKKSFYKKDFSFFRDEEESGINKMINRKAQTANDAFSDNDMVNVPIKDEVRLNKYIANSGVCSRREADNFILAGVVTVNGEVVTELGTKVNIYTDDVRFNGERLKG